MSRLGNLADKVGQITFRIETNILTLSNRQIKSAPAWECIHAITRDVEKLKEVKREIENIDNE